MDTGEGSHPSKKHSSDDVEIIWDELPQEDLIRYGEPDKSKVGFKVNYDGASSSEPSGISEAVSVNRADVREEIRNRKQTVREKLRAELVGFVDKYHTRLTSELDMDKE